MTDRPVSFGTLLRQYRRAAHGPGRGGLLTQQALADLVAGQLGTVGAPTAQTISNWERDRHPPDAQDRPLLLALLGALAAAGGLTTAADADALLVAGNYAPLTTAQREVVSGVAPVPPASGEPTPAASGAAVPTPLANTVMQQQWGGINFGIGTTVTITGDVIVGDKIIGNVSGAPTAHAPTRPPLALVGLASLVRPPRARIGHDAAYTALCADYVQMAAARRENGTIVCLVAPTGMGKSALARAVARYAQSQGGAALVARFWPAGYLSAEELRDLAIDDPFVGLDTLSRQRQVAALWPEAVTAGRAFFTTLLAQLSTQAKRPLSPQREERPDEPSTLGPLIRRLASDRPVVLVLECLHDASPAWIEAIRQLTLEITTARPVLLLLTIEDAAGAAFDLAEELGAADAARILGLDAISEPDIAAWLGQSHPELPRRLHRITAGMPALVEQCWDEWLTRGLVWRSDAGFWSFSTFDDPLLAETVAKQTTDLLRALPDDAPFTAAQTAQILRCAAQEGPVFTAPALATALGIDLDQLIDFFDDYLCVADEDAGDAPGERLGMVHEANFVRVTRVGQGQDLARYRFASPYLFTLWQQAPREADDPLGALADALAALHEEATNTVADQLVRLYDAAGQEAQAAQYRQRREGVASVAALRWQARLLEGQVDEQGQAALGRVYTELARHYDNAGHYAEMQRYGELARDIAVRWHNAALEASALGWIGVALHGQGAYSEAHPLLERALAIRKQIFGPTHPDTATSLGNLAMLLRTQGAYSEARPLLERALAISEQALGPTHPQTATSLNNLAALLHAQGVYSEARPLYERALAIREQTLSSTHPDIALSLDNLAVLLHAQGVYSEARPLLERVLAISEQALGSTHPQTVISLNNLAALLHAQGASAKARSLYERALAIHEQMLGPSHPYTVTVRNNLASLNALLAGNAASDEAVL